MRNVSQSLAALTSLMQNQANNNNNKDGQGNNTNPVVRSDNNMYKRFKEMNPPEFNGTEGVLEAAEWIRQVEKIFEVLGCTDTEKVKLAAFTMKKEAGYWWEDKVRTYPEATHTWTWIHFKEQFDGKFLPYHARNDLRLRFYELKQGNMTVDQYSAKFMELSRYAPEVICTEELKAERFVQGLRPYLFCRVSAFMHKNFEAAVATANVVEKADHSLQASRNQKPHKRFRQNNQTSFAKRQNTGDRDQGQRSRVTCAKCGKMHKGVCRMVSGACYVCGRMDHKRDNCPFRQRQIIPQQQQ